MCCTRKVRIQRHKYANTNSEDILVYIALVHLLLAEHHTAQSLHNLLQASTSAHPPFERSWQLSELRPPAACGHVSESNTQQSQQHNTHSAPREHFLLARSTGQCAASRRHGHMFISFVSPLLRNSHHFISSVTEPFCHFACGVFASMTFWHFINRTREAVRLSPESPFMDVCDLTDPPTSWVYWPRIHRTLGRHLNFLAALTQQGPAKHKRYVKVSQAQHIPWLSYQQQNYSAFTSSSSEVLRFCFPGTNCSTGQQPVKGIIWSSTYCLHIA